MKRWHIYLAAALLILVSFSPLTSQTANGQNASAGIVLAESNAEEEKDDEIVVFSDTTSTEAYDEEDEATYPIPATPVPLDDTFSATEFFSSSWFVQLIWLSLKLPFSLLDLLPYPLKWLLILLAVAGIVVLLVRRVKHRSKPEESAVSPAAVQANRYKPEEKAYYYDAPKLIRGIQLLGIGVAFMILEVWIRLWYIAGILGVFISCLAVAHIIIALLPHWRARHHNPEHETTDEKEN